MPESYLIIHLLFAVIQFLTGVLANGIIVVVNGTDLIKQRKMIPSDLLLSCLAISRICLHLAFFCINLAGLSWIEFTPFSETFAILVFVNESGLWFAAWLSVFYCGKIAPIAHPLFFWLKMRIAKLVPWLIFGSLLYTSIISVFHSKHTWTLSQKVWLDLSSNNATTQIKELSVLQCAFIGIELSLPLLIFLISALLLIFFLGRHTRQMRNTAMGTRNPSTSIHTRAFLSILSFLVLYLSYYAMIALLLSQIFKLRNFIFRFCILMIGSYSSGHSIILVLGNCKLKQNAKKFLLHSKCCQ
ncbi:PREDICTED: taste receptor type 2 member 1 [Ceratotherium simum simum]|uniref:Taste receptor type 2 n=1 Tax=Ceratotherium simum simum TaxID=73337 RepID=A0ABM0I4H8_CERSS|nr:PREDICTED: taste receptor type 2 member 1 [Ceratotherium simum simum]